MDTSVAKDMISVIRAERDRRERDFRAREDPDMEGDLWPFMGEPFFNELCLALLVAIWHHVESELVLLAPRVTSNGEPIRVSEYQRLVEEERKNLRENGRGCIMRKLKLKGINEWDTSMEILRLLANSYKHEPMATPDKCLLERLGLDASRNYAPIPESPTLKERLAAFLDLRDSAGYCDIADELVARVDRFLAEVKAQQPVLSPVKREPANPSNRDSYLA